MNTIRISVLLAAPFVMLPFAGCGGKPAHEPPPASSDAADHDFEESHVSADDVERPVDFAAAVARIVQYRDSIRDELAAGRPGRAHRPLDEAVFVLDWLPEIARDSGVPREDWEEVNTSAQAIRTAFDQVHDNIDAGEDPGFAAVADDVEQAIRRLEKVARETSTPAEVDTPQRAEGDDDDEHE